MGLFSKKTCSICGGDAGRVFVKKLEDGILCKECTNKLSPWFSERRSSTVAQIQEQLDYREANKQRVEEFKVTRVLNSKYKVLLDEDASRFLVARTGKWREENPDVIDFADVTGCSYQIDETKTDVTPEPPDRHDDHDDDWRPAPPPRERVYEYDYTFNMTINVNNPYFTEMTFQVNENRIEDKDAEYDSAVSLANEIKSALTEVREGNRAAAEAANQPKQAVKCPNCGATTIPDESGRCEYCGAPC